MAAVAGMLAVMVFMLIYYRGAGINADLALLLNLVILLGFMGFSHATLTLPGIAGVILTIGMASTPMCSSLSAFARSCGLARAARPR